MDFIRWYSPSQAYLAKHVSNPQLTATVISPPPKVSHLGWLRGHKTCSAMGNLFYPRKFLLFIVNIDIWLVYPLPANSPVMGSFNGQAHTIGSIFSKLPMIWTVCRSWINYPYINVIYENEKLWGGKYYRTPPPPGTQIIGPKVWNAFCKSII